jgi:hypothetical protein
MKKLIFVLFMLLSINLFSQDYKIEKNYDSFENDSITYFYSNKLDGGSFFGMRHCWFNIYRWVSKENTKTYAVEIILSYGGNFSFKEKSIGNSLLIKADTIRYEFGAIRTDYNPSKEFTISKARFIIDIENLRIIANSKDVKIRLISLNDEKLDFNFDEDNFLNIRDFLKKYCK